jgi:hypothetical protein
MRHSDVVEYQAPVPSQQPEHFLLRQTWAVLARTRDRWVSPDSAPPRLRWMLTAAPTSCEEGIAALQCVIRDPTPCRLDLRSGEVRINDHLVSLSPEEREAYTRAAHSVGIDSSASKLDVDSASVATRARIRATVAATCRSAGLLWGDQAIPDHDWRLGIPAHRVTR